jgi:thiamine biosynthesis lipoprotein
MKIRPYYFIVILLVILIAVEYIYTHLIFSAERTVYLMGAPVRIKIYGSNSPLHTRLAFERIWWIEKDLNRFKKDSQISLLNELAGKAPLEVSRDTYECLKLAKRMARLTRGAFDVTGGHDRSLVLDHKARKVFLKKKGVVVDLGGVGKGYAAEMVRKLLVEKGAKSGMIDMRSSIAVFGPRTWRVGIQHPRDKEKYLGVVVLGDGDSLATSGDYERGQHIIDPRTGRPATRTQGVTVTGKNAAVADALSTALFVLGPKAGIELVETLPQIEAMIVDKSGKIVKSSGFALKKK